MNKFCVVKCLYWNRDMGNILGYQIDGEIYLFYVNKWLHELRSPNTARDYAYKICKWLNYLSTVGKDYVSATQKDLNNFLIQLNYKLNDNIYSIYEGNERRSTVLKYINVISSFYSRMISLRDDISMPYVLKKNIKDNQLLSGIVWNKETKALYVNKFSARTKPKKQYVKWYSDEQIEAILSNLNTYRDKAVFMLSLEGMRIDEVLSVRLSDYDFKNECVLAYRSKGKPTGDTNRVVAIKKATLAMIERYLLHERSVIEESLINKEIIIPDELFLNLSHNNGKPLMYRNYLSILKRAAKKSGINEDLVRTHSGRSTSVMRDIFFHIDHPDELTLEDIRIKYGWSTLSSMNPYVDTTNPLLAKNNAEKLKKVREELQNNVQKRNHQ